MKTFFEHENHPQSPSLSDRGKLQQGKSNQICSLFWHRRPTRNIQVLLMSKCSMVLLWCTSYPLPTLPHSTNIRQWCLCSPYHDTLGYCRKSLRGLGYLHHQQHKGVSKGETRQGDTTEGSWSEQAARNWPDFPHDSHELFTFLSEKIASTACPDGKEVFSTSDTIVVGTEPCHSICCHVTMKRLTPG